MGFKPKRTLPGKGKVEPFSKVPNVGYCPKCMVKRYTRDCRCLVCAGKVPA